MLMKKLKIKNKKIFFSMGDVTCEVILSRDLYFSGKHLADLCFPILFHKTNDGAGYFSEQCQLDISGQVREYSAVGEIAYFPTLKLIGINLEESEQTLEIPRYVFGKIKGELCKMQSLRMNEEAIIFMSCTFYK